MKEIKRLEAYVRNNILECEQFSKQLGEKGEYLEAIKLLAMVDAYKKIAFRIDKILNEAKSRSGSEGK